MKELKEFKNLTEAMVVNPNDFGGQQNLEDDHFEGDMSYLESAIAGMVGDLASYGIERNEADKMIKDVVKELVKDKSIEEVPSEGATDGQKARWLSHSRPVIKAHLKLMGAIL